MRFNESTRWPVLAVSTIVLAACGGGTETGTGAAPVPEQSVQVRSLTYTDSGNWLYRAELQTVADATPDANGYLARYEQYARNTAGTVQTWAFGGSPAAGDETFWNGSQWRTCGLGYRTTISQLDGTGTRQFNYCDMAVTGSETVVETDVSGLLMAPVLAGIRTRTGTDGLIPFASWGPAGQQVLGSAVFTPGSRQQEVRRTVTASMPRFADSPDNKRRAYNADIAAGGSGGTSAACANLPTSAQIDDISYFPIRLEQIISAASGTPCFFNGVTTAAGSSLPSHEWWGPTTQEFGELQGVDYRPAGTGIYYKALPSLRVSFPGNGQRVFYYSCLQRQSDGSIRNCTVQGEGTYRIDQLGDARVMTFDGLPAVFAGLDQERVFIERDGRVAVGTREPLATRTAVGFNDEGTRALFSQLLIPVPTPQ
ncbi:MAG: hypothetical protein R3E68_00510 [Burkholderiaceae bacterium]